MNYVRCINNKTYVRLPDESVNGALADLTIGAVYKVLPTAQHERDMGMIRIIDNSGEDYPRLLCFAIASVNVILLGPIPSFG